MDRGKHFIGQSSVFLDAVERASRAAPLNRPVLVVGERGTGKELIAERLHHLSGRWAGPHVVLNCAALPETLIEAALAGLDRAAVRSVLDLGTGTGCLLLAVLSELPGAWGLGVDRAPAAAALAQRNACAIRLHHRAAFLCGDWATAVAGRFDLVLSNPPYIAAPDLGSLMPEVGCHEPAAALDGGADGLDASRAILPDLPGLLSPGGLAVLELGRGQADAVGTLADGFGLRQAGLRADLAGVPRALVLQAA